jgi:surface antigen
MRWLSTLAIILGCAACQPQPDGTQASAVPDQPQPPQGQPQLACHDFTAPVTAGGYREQASGQACGHPDGSWRVVQDTPGLPAQTFVLPSSGQPAAAVASPAAQAPPNQPPCSSYTAPAAVGGQPQQAVIEACRNPTGAGGSHRIRPACRRRSTRFRRRPRHPILMATPTPPTTPIPSSSRIGEARPCSSGSRRRSSSYTGSTISTMGLATALGTPSPAVLGTVSRRHAVVGVVGVGS